MLLESSDEGAHLAVAVDQPLSGRPTAAGIVSRSRGLNGGADPIVHLYPAAPLHFYAGSS